MNFNAGPGLPVFPVFNPLRAVLLANASGCGQCVLDYGFALKIAPTNAPAAATSPAAVNFPVQLVGTTSSAQTLTIVDLGSAALTVSDVAASGDFSIQPNSCGTLTAAGGSCTIQVTFTPTAAGPRSGTLSITDNSAGSPHTVPLNGEGGQGSASVSPTGLTFGSQQVGTTSSAQTVTLTNNGALALQVSRIQASSPFQETNTCGTSVAGNNSCTISVTFTPTTAGAATGTLTFTDSATDSPQSVALSGNATTAPGSAASLSQVSLSFGSQAISTTSAAQQVTVTNSGTAALTISSIQTTNQFNATNTCSASVAPGGNCTIQVTFTPSASGSQTGTLTIADNAPNSPQSVALSGTGSGSAPTIGLGLASGASASATVTAGATAAYALSIGGAGMSGTASLTCSGAPTGATCSVPATVTLSATTASSFNVSVPTTARSHVWLFPTGPTPWLWALAILGCLVLVKAASFQPSPRLRWRFAPLLALALCACGGGSSTTPTPTPPLMPTAPQPVPTPSS
jgi:hypothetical protein